ncbi:hypothetical protein KA183_06115 [bacterium]|nr:hypothetical protein [bacterium]QQR56308.1 MAG: hypothetical protein IPG59_15010 [Candidatus Melainabacteria bacterium]
MSQESTDVQLGELLIRTGLIQPEQFEAAYKLSFKMRLPIGRVLTMHGHVSEDHLRTALELQSRMRDGLIPFDHAIQAFMQVIKHGVALDAAIARIAPAAPPKTMVTENRLGELLVAAGIASRSHVDEAMRASSETGLPLGMVLMNNGKVQRAALNSALAAQKLVRDGAIERDKAVYALKLARLRAIPLEQSLRENVEFQGAMSETFATGELFLMAGVVSESQLMTAKEIEVTEEVPIEEVFVALGYASAPCAKAAKYILSMVGQGMLFEDQAARIIKRIQYASSNKELQDVLAKLDSNPEEILEEREQIEITDILKKAGLISDKDLQIATALALANRVPLIKTLFDAKLIDEQVMNNATELKTYLDHDLLKLEQATIVMSYCLENNMTVDETLDTFGWTAPV